MVDMYSSLKGQMSCKGRGWVELLVAGVGYKLFLAEKFLAEVEVGEEWQIPVHLVVSQDDLRLFGFKDWEELDLFELLITVSGVGPKTALQIVGSYQPLAIRQAIGSANLALFEKIKGIGKKTAQRIIVDLKGKIGGNGELDLTGEITGADNELLASLKQLGFEKKEIENCLKKMPGDLTGLEEQLQWVLRNIK